MIDEPSANTDKEITSASTEETCENKNSAMQALPTSDDKPKNDTKSSKGINNTENNEYGKESIKKMVRKKKKSWIKRLSEIGTINQKEVVEFTRHLSVMLSAGVTIFEAINFLKDQTKNKVFSSRLENIIDSLNNGQSLSASMSRYPKIFPGIYTSIIHVGEQSGSLAETMLDLSNHLEENDIISHVPCLLRNGSGIGPSHN